MIVDLAFRFDVSNMLESSVFTTFIQPGDQVMADRGFKIQDILNFYQCTLCIPPSKHTNLQMAKVDVAKTTKIANVPVYVDQWNCKYLCYLWEMISLQHVVL